MYLELLKFNKQMKTYYFTCGMSYVGGSGVVRAKNKAEALPMVNETIKNNQGEPITEQDLIEVKPNTVVLITNGDY